MPFLYACRHCRARLRDARMRCVGGGKGWASTLVEVLSEWRERMAGGEERGRLRSSKSSLKSSLVSVRPDGLRVREKHKLVEEDAEDADGEVRRDVACRQSPVAGGGEVEESEQAQNGKATLSD
jgi:hypothetical protein